MSDKKDYRSDHSDVSDDEASQYHSVAGGSSTTSSEYLSISSPTASSVVSDPEKNSAKVLKDSKKESDAESSDYDEETDEFLGAPPPGQKFPANVAPGEKWLRCPYYRSHFYICKQYVTHLYRCRAKYLEEMGMTDANADVVICRFDSMHHGPKAKLEKHELNCDNGSMYYMYLDHFIERQRYSNYMDMKELEKKMAGPLLSEVDDDDKVEGVKKDNAEAGKEDTVEAVKEDTVEAGKEDKVEGGNVEGAAGEEKKFDYQDDTQIDADDEMDGSELGFY